MNSPTETDFDGNKSDATATKVKLNERLGLDDKVRNLEYPSQLHVLQLIYKFFFKGMYAFKSTCTFKLHIHATICNYLIFE